MVLLTVRTHGPHVARKMIGLLTVRARMAYPLKSQLGLISMPVYGLNL